MCFETGTSLRNLKFLCAAAIVGILVPHAVSAHVVITEIMYDLPSGSDSGREWIEIFNTGTAPVPLTTWKLFENGTNHKITSASGGATLAPGAYGVIADNAVKFKADWPNFSGALFDSTFSLGNSGETIVLRDASSTDLASAAYQSGLGASGDGNSLNRAGDAEAFVPRSPSPGAAMAVAALAPPAPKEPAPKVASKPKTGAQKEKKSGRASVGDTTAYPIASEISGVDTKVSSGQVALAGQATAAPQSGASYTWWLGAIALSGAAGAALFVARRLGRKEWDIVEENSN